MPNPATLAEGRSVEQEAYLKQMAEEQAKINAYRTATSDVIDREVRTTSAVERAKRQVEAFASLPQTLATADQTLSVIDQAMNHPGLATLTGLSGRIDPRAMIPGTDAADARALLEQIQGATFLEAFNRLRGGGQITEVEGKKAENAIARLSTAQSDDAIRKSLGELRGIIENAKVQAVNKVSGGGGGAVGAGGPEMRARNPQTGEVRVLRNGMWVRE